MPEVHPDAAIPWDGSEEVKTDETYLRSRFVPQANTPESQAILIAFGRSMMAWNTLEGVLRVMLEAVIDMDGPAGRATILALSADAGGMDLERALSSLADAVLDGERREDVLNLVRYVGAIRPYRNYYAHGLNHVSRHGDKVVAPVLTWTAKGGIKHQVDQITIQQLDQLSTWCARAADFSMGLLDWWYPVTIPGHTPTRPFLGERPKQLEKLTRPLDSYAIYNRKRPTKKGRR